MAAMAVDLTTKHIGALENNSNNNYNSDTNNNESMKHEIQHGAVDLSLPKECKSSLDITANIDGGDNAMDIFKRLMKVTASDIGDNDKSQIEMTALNLLCLARLQEMLKQGLDGKHPLPAHLLHPSSPSSSTPWNRKMYSCDYEGCGKVSSTPLHYYLITLALGHNPADVLSRSKFKDFLKIQ